MEHFSDNREFDLYRDINTRTNGEIYIGCLLYTSQYDTEGAGTEGRPGRTAHARDRPGYDLYALSEPDTG